MLALLCLTLGAVPAPIQAPAPFQAVPGPPPCLECARLLESWDWALVEAGRRSARGEPFDPPLDAFNSAFTPLARAGHPEAILWCLQAEGLGDGMGERSSWRLRALFEEVVAAGTAPWVERALPLLARHRDGIGKEAVCDLVACLALDAGASEGLRREAYLAEVACLCNPFESDRLRLEAFGLMGAPSGHSAAELEALARRVVAMLEDAEREHRERSTIRLPDLVVRRPGMAPGPAERWERLLVQLAAEGSRTAAVWTLVNTLPLGPVQRRRHVDLLEQVAATGLEADEVGALERWLTMLVDSLGMTPFDATLEGLMARLPDEDRARLLLAYGRALGERGWPVYRERALEVLREVTAGYPDDSAAERAAGLIERYGTLVVGAPFPELEGTDVDGDPVRLADARGKVTVVDFWAFWYGPCVGQLPNLKTLAERHPERLVVFGVNVDSDPTTYRERRAEWQLPWTDLWLGSPRHPWLLERGIEAFPDTFVLDADHVIRAEGLRGAALEQAVERLLAEQER